MWRMLVKQGRGKTKIDYSDIRFDETSGRGQAHWEAHYKFSQTGSQVHNGIDAEFTVKDGKILKHRDSFSFSRWGAQALSPAVKIAPWFFQFLVRKKALASLSDFTAKRN